MSDSIDLDDAVTPTEPETTPAEEQTSTDAVKVFNQEEVNSLLAEQKRKIREQYTAFEDYKTKAEQYDTVIARAENAERELAETKTDVLKARIAAEYGVPESVLVGDSEESLRATAQMLTEWRGVGSTQTEAPGSRKVNQSGASKTPEVLSAKEKAAAALRKAL